MTPREREKKGGKNREKKGERERKGGRKTGKGRNLVLRMREKPFAGFKFQHFSGPAYPHSLETTLPRTITTVPWGRKYNPFKMF